MPNCNGDKAVADRIVDGAAGHFIKSGKTAAGRFSTLLPLTLLFIAIFYGGTSAVRWWLTARFLSFLVCGCARTHANGPADAGRTRLLFAQKFSR